MILIFLFLMVVISVAGYIILNPPVRYEDDTIDGVKNILWNIVQRKNGWRIVSVEEKEGELYMMFRRGGELMLSHSQLISVRIFIKNDVLICRTNMDFNFNQIFDRDSLKTNKFVDKTLTKALYDFKDSLTEKEKEDLI